jgi:hypothetical protein
MEIIFHVVRQVVVENDLDIVDINSTRGNVSGNEELKSGLPELVHHTISHQLRHIAVQTICRISLSIQVIDKFVDHAFGIAEDDAQLEIVDIDQACQQLDLIIAIHFIVDLLDRRHGERLLFDAHLLWIARVLFNQLLNWPRNGRGKEYGLAFRRRRLQDHFDIIAKTHVEHDVDFIQDDDLQTGKLERAATHVVHDPAGRTDHNIRALFEPRQLPIERLSAVNRQCMQAALEECQHFLRNLNCELASRTQDQYLHSALTRINFLDRRNGEGRRFARPGLRLADNISSGHQNWNGAGLYRCGLFKTQFVDCFQYFSREAQLGK